MPGGPPVSVIGFGTPGAGIVHPTPANPAVQPLTAYDREVIKDAPAIYIVGYEASGTPGDVYSGNRNNLNVIGGTPTYLTASLLPAEPQGSSITLNGTDQWFSAPDANSLDFGDVGAYEMWVVVLTRTGARTFVDKGPNSFQLGYDGTNKWFEMRVNSVGGGVAHSAAHDDTNVYHVVMNKNGATRQFIINGVDETVLGTNLTAASTAIALNIGREGTSFGEYSNIRWSHFAAYPAPLSLARAQAHYNAGLVFASAIGEVATGTGAASDITPSLAATGGVAAGTGAAANASTSVAVTAGLASGTGAAFAATAPAIASAGLASGTGAAANAAASLAPTGGVAAGTGAAAAATTKVTPTVAAATGTGASSNASASIAVSPYGVSGPITATLLTSGADATDSAATAVTASVTPTANRLVLAAIHTRVISGTPLAPSGLSGNGLTWVKIDEYVYDDSGETGILSLWRGMGSSPSAGAITITHGDSNSSGVIWSVSEFANVDTSGTNGSGAVVQTVKDRNLLGGVTALSVTLGAFASADNATYAAFAAATSAGFTPGSGFTELSDDNVTGLVSAQLQTEWRNDNDTSVDSTSDTAAKWAGIALELRRGVGVGIPAGTGQAFNATVSVASGTNAAAGNAAGTGAAANATATVAPTSVNAAGIGAAGTVGPAVAPTPTAATGTGAANNASTSAGGNVSVNPGVAAGTGSAGTVGPSVAPVVGNAAGTGTANNATGIASSPNASAGNAAGTGTSPTSSVAIEVTPFEVFGPGLGVTAGVASGTGTAFNSTTPPHAPAIVSLGTGTAFTITGTLVSPAIAVTSGTGAAYNASVGIVEYGYAEVAQGTGTAYDASAPALASPQPTTATGTGTAPNATPSVAVNAGHAAGTGVANNAAAFDIARGTGTAYGPSANVAPKAGSTGTGQAFNATARIEQYVTPTAASGTGTGLNPSAKVSPVIDRASGLGAAFDATTVVGSNVNVTVGPTSGLGAAFPGFVTIAVNAGIATGTGAALNAQGRPSSAAATGTGTAYDAMASSRGFAAASDAPLGGVGLTDAVVNAVALSDILLGGSTITENAADLVLADSGRGGVAVNDR